MDRVMSDREMLSLAYGAICVDAATNENMEQVRQMIAQHLFGLDPEQQPECEDANDTQD